MRHAIESWVITNAGRDFLRFSLAALDYFVRIVQVTNTIPSRVVTGL